MNSQLTKVGACGVPVIGGRSGGVPDAIAHGETGLLVDGNSPQAVAEAVIHLLTKPEVAQRMGRAGRHRVCQNLTWNHSADKIRDLLNGCRQGNSRLSH